MKFALNRKNLVMAATVLVAMVVLASYFVLRHAADKYHLTLYGNIDIREVDLAFLVDGRIAKLYVDEGDRITAGERLASLEKDYLNDALAADRARADAAAANYAKLKAGNRVQEIAKARAGVEVIKANLVNARIDYQRQKNLARQDIASQSQLDRAKALQDSTAAELKAGQADLELMEAGFRREDIAQGRATLDAARAQVSYDERRLKDADIFAPADGVILTRVREAGSIVAPGQPVYDMALTRPIWVRAYVGETNLGKIHPGMMATVTADSLPGKSYTGQIGFISPVAEFTPKSVETPELRSSLVYRLRIVIEKPDEELRQGMPVTVVLNLKPAK